MTTEDAVRAFLVGLIFILLAFFAVSVTLQELGVIR